MEKIQLSNIFKTIENPLLKDMYVYSVEYYEKDKLLKVYIESEHVLRNGLLDSIKEGFEGRFSTLDVEVYIKCNEVKSLEAVFPNYRESFMASLEDRVPSSKSWLKESSIAVKANSMLIYPESQFAYDRMAEVEIVELLRNKVFSDLGLEIKLEISKERVSLEDKDVLSKRKEEEAKFAEKALKAIPESAKSKKTSTQPASSSYSIGKLISDDSMEIGDINIETGYAIVEGQVFGLSSKEIRGPKYIVEFNLTDLTGSITVKSFMKEKDFQEFSENISDGSYIKVSGGINYDDFSRCIVLNLRGLNIKDKYIRKDLSKEKRVELHLHSQMSSMDGVTPFKELAQRAKDWGHKAIAITDHGIVQSFPEAMYARDSLGIKILYGLEGYLLDDSKKIVEGLDSSKDYESYVVFDIETTGLSPKNDGVTEIGAVKVVNGQVVEEYNQLINPEKPIPDKIVELTGITDDMVRDQPKISEVIGDFKDFCEGSILVAHNAGFDVGFMREQYLRNNLSLDNPVLDTLELTRAMFPDFKNHKLNVIAKNLGVSLENHHRAVDDARATAQIFIKCMEENKRSGIESIHQVNNLIDNKNLLKERPYHVIILVKNLTGLKNLYKLVSEAHLNYFYRQPRIPRTVLEKYREGLIVGSACEAGELFSAILSNKSDEEIRMIAKYYDFLEIQPVGNNEHLVRRGLVENFLEIQDINRKIVNLGETLNKPVVATGDVHFLDKEDEVFRRILMSGQGFSDADNQPPLYLKTTDEMLEEFSYLGEEKSYEVVVENTNMIADSIEDIKPIPDGTYSPVIEGSDEELREITYGRAREIYGEDIPEIVEERLERELGSIIKNGYAVMYIIAQKLVWKSNDDGYLVGSRGSVGSSFAATMSGITEVNPLVPHYVCPKCKYSEFIEDGSVGSGIDLPEKDCPKCGHDLNRDGHDIPFEVFLGFEGDKEPDIDLNFAGEYQPRAHKYTEDLFGEGYVFRAGTIGTVAEKTAYGFVKKYHEERGISVHPAEIDRLVRGCTGIKRTSGQHPGGVMVVPNYKDIYDFTPIQYPADDKTSGVITTHFDYNAISGRILKLDILGHDVPSIIRMLEDITGITATDIALNDPETMSIFTGVEALNFKEDVGIKIGTLGIPEFGTKFVRQMLEDTQPSTFGELVRISGLSHGTDVWLNNAQDLVRGNVATLKEVISTRDDIMLYLIYSGLDKKLSFKIMEKVRKGKGITEEEEAAMRALKVPEWYIDSCKKIKYMFPKAHAAAYVMMSFRIAYFKVHYPQAFYATYFTTKAQDFDSGLVLKGLKAVETRIKDIESLGMDCTTKEKNLLTVLEVVMEMYGRGFEFMPVDLYKSHSDVFLIEDGKILPPLKSLDGVGENAARNLAKAREDGEFLSKDELAKRAKVGRVVLEALEEHGCLRGMPESNQLSLF